MIVQQVTFRVGTNDLSRVYQSVKTLEELYVSGEWLRFEIYREQEDPNTLVELATFPDQQAFDAFDADGSVEKQRVYSEFGESGGVEPDSVVIRIVRRDTEPQ